MKSFLATGTMALALVLAGCAATEEVQPTVSTSESPTETSSAAPAPDPQRPQADPQADPQARTCSFDVTASIESSIRGQTEAFGAGDFELAYSFASPNFRKNVDLASFVRVIESSYGPLLGSTELRFSDCISNEEQTIGLIDVRFVEGETDLYGLRYLMVLADEGWRVEGASNLELVASGS